MTRAVATITMPPSLNRLWRGTGKHMYRSDKYNAWLDSAGWELKQVRMQKISGHFIITLRFGPRQDDWDLDNRAKATLDLLEHQEIIENDSLADEIHLLWDDRITGCQIEIMAVEPVASKVSAARSVA